MRLTRFTECALCLMAYLARSGQACTIADAAAGLGISRDNLVKVVHHLSRCGLLATMRGKNGGIRLARTADTITLADVVRSCEADFRLLACFDAGAACACRGEALALRGAFHQAARAFLAGLEATTLAAVAAR